MSKLRIIMVVCFFAAFGAGLTAGMLWERQVLAGANAPGSVVATSPLDAPPLVLLPVPGDTQAATPPVTPNLNVPDVQHTSPQSVPPPTGAGPGNNPGGGGQDWLAHELKLSSEQNEKMRQIWSGVMRDSMALRHEKHDAVRKEKDDSVKALFSAEQRAAYENILKQADNKYAQLDSEGRALQENAVAQTREILTPEQRVKYDELRKKREQWQPHRGGHDSRGDQRQDHKPGQRPGGPDNKPDNKPEHP